MKQLKYTVKGNKRTDHLENSGAEALQSDKFLFSFFALYTTHMELKKAAIDIHIQKN